MREIILGTDWWTDCDDAVALRILARAHKEGKLNIKGIAVNACMEYSVTSLEGFLNLEGVCNIPIGIDAEAVDFGGNPPYQRRLAAFSEKYLSNSDAENAVRMYRRLLSAADTPIEMIEIGYLQVVANLLESGPDDISDKTGVELVEEKVSKVWVMAGKWDRDGEKENNFCRNERARVAAEKFCRLCPAEVTFLGWEVGATVITGGNLSPDDHLHKALSDHGSGSGRSSWDPMLVELALIGNEQEAGYATVCGTASVDEKTGANYFKENDLGKHKYVVKKCSDDFYQKRINELIKVGKAVND